MLAIVQPILIISIVVITVLHSAWKLIRERRLDYRIPILVGLGGGLYLLYQYWVLTTDPILAQWTAQNITPAPAWWDFILCLSPGIFYCVLAVSRRKRLAFQPHPVMIIWLISLVVLTYLPFDLQRRFMAGIYIPLVTLAFLGVTAFLQNRRLTRSLHNLIWILSLPGLILFLLIPVYGISTHNDAFYLTRGERDALTWLNDFGGSGSLVLASPSMGQFIPTYTEDCVFAGHPFETLDRKPTYTSLRLYIRAYTAFLRRTTIWKAKVWILFSMVQGSGCWACLISYRIYRWPTQMMKSPSTRYPLE